MSPLNRPTTDDPELDGYTTRGWTVLRSVLSPEEAGQLARRGANLLAGRDERPRATDQFLGDRRDDEFERIHAELDDPCHLDDAFRLAATSPRLGGLAARLVGAPKVRVFKDLLLVKPGRSDSLPTPTHQDMPFWPLDRSNAVTLWIALGEVTPDMGSLSFYDGSHRWGLLGSHLAPAGPLEDRHRWLHEEQPSDGRHLAPGDATAHNSMTVHRAEPNLTAVDRWAWAITYIDSATVYTGGSHRVIDPLGLSPNSLLDAPRFLDVEDPAA